MCAKIKAAACLLMCVLALCGCAETAENFPSVSANSSEAISTSAPERKHTMQKIDEGEKQSFEVSASSFEPWTATGGSDPDSQRWIAKNGGIFWDVAADKKLPHYDHIETSGLASSTIVNYGVLANGRLAITRHVTFPTLRKLPNDTYGSLSHNFTQEQSAAIVSDGKKTELKVQSVEINGMITITLAAENLRVVRTLCPGTSTAFIERYEITNTGEQTQSIEFSAPYYFGETDSSKGYRKQRYEIFFGVADQNGIYDKGVSYAHTVELKSGGCVALYTVCGASRSGEAFTVDCPADFEARAAYLADVSEELILETPDENVNTMFALAKIRSGESIIRTDEELYLHSPGGGNYYGGIWANDQCEYVYPLFGYSGYGVGKQAALDGYRLFMRYMRRSYAPIPSSIVALGKLKWFAIDRGDASMFAYGAARYALSCGDKAVAQELFEGIEWCLTYALKQKTADGVIASASDELETRYPSGDANLCTSSLTYDALVSAAYLARDLGKTELAAEYEEEAQALRAAMEAHFGYTVEGYDTYRYYDGNTVLRGWICIPLTCGIYNRAEETARALFDSRLWSQNGVVTQAGDTTFWDRSTLYAFRGAFAAGQADLALDKLLQYTRTRLLGEHVPYAVEAWPEGNQAHLSAESGLYARIFTEGLFGLRPTGLGSFQVSANLPSAWASAALRRIHICGTVVDVRMKREGERIRVSVTDESGALLAEELLDAFGTLSVEMK